MPHFAHTPEALLGRNDSKNPSTTCKGITSSGRSCRRALAASRSPSGMRASADPALGGVVAIVHEDGEIQEADFYCWQHRDQAQELATLPTADRNTTRRNTELYYLKEKSSIDTMVQKLGLDAAVDVEDRDSRKQTRNTKPPRKTHTTDFASEQQTRSEAPNGQKYNLGRTNYQPRPNPRKASFWRSLCCMSGDDDDYVEIVRHRRRTERTQMAQVAPSVPSDLHVRPARPEVASARIPGPKPVPTQQASPTDTRTSDLLALIPGHHSPQTTSALLAELTKPIGLNDEEGYIYIFWLTPQTKTTPPETTARSLLAPPSQRPSNGRRISDVMTEYSFDGDDNDLPTSRAAGLDGISAKKNRTIMLKIGRASNITRRMNEWQRQCGYALNLVRWYPHVSSTPRSSPQHERQVRYSDLSRPPPQHWQSSSDTVHKVPCVKRVERLIHLELAAKQVKRLCAACGKEHREWFEVEASQAGVRGVDEVVRRWVGWGESQVM